jgi:hypothetical protein
MTKATGLSCTTNLPLIELAGSGLDLCGGCTLVRLGVPLTFTSVSQKQRDRWLGPNVGPKRLLGTARVPGVAWPSVDGLEHGWPGSVGVVGAECHLFAGLVLGALHVEFHADSPVGVAAENHPVTGFV